MAMAGMDIHQQQDRIFPQRPRQRSPAASRAARCRPGALPCFSITRSCRASPSSNVCRKTSTHLFASFAPLPSLSLSRHMVVCCSTTSALWLPSAAVLLLRQRSAAQRLRALPPCCAAAILLLPSCAPARSVMDRACIACLAHLGLSGMDRQMFAAGWGLWHYA